MKRTTSQTKKIESTFLKKPKNIFKEEIQERLLKGEEIIKNSMQIQVDIKSVKSKFSSWDDYNLELLKQSFNEPNNEYRRSYEKAGESSGMMISTMGARTTITEILQELISKINSKVDNLRKLAQKIEILKSSEPGRITIDNEKNLDMSQIFIVHGHDVIAKIETARFVEKLGFSPIILHEQASSGKTIIEKIEDYSNVGFGIVLYTPCDIGAKKGEEAKFKSRARQNVVFEHGFLIGKIGRGNVCALVKESVETPNDISGVVYISMDGDWKLDIAKELRNSGYKVDMNLVI